MKETLTLHTRKAWFWLLDRAHCYPWQTGLAVAALLLAVNLVAGGWLNHWTQGWVQWLDSSVTVFTAVSLAFAWGFALVLRAQRQHAALAFRNAGTPLDRPNFEAALILASRSEALMDWHLWNIGEQRVEFVWTDLTQGAVATVLRTHDAVACLRGPERAGALVLADALSLQDAKAVCSTLLREILVTYPRHKVCVDVTGGTVPMSVAAFQVAEELGVTSIYLIGTNRAAPGASPQIRPGHTHDPSEGSIVILSDHSKQVVNAGPDIPGPG